MEEGQIDENTRGAILRLTGAERECLRRCLDHQTAKEMALDLDISHHAVEKRLKMARAKLGLSSSLEVARLVEQAERSGLLGPDASDLTPRGDDNDEGGTAAARRDETAWITRHRFSLVSGAIMMSFLVAIAIFLALQSSGVVEAQAPSATVSAEAPAAQPRAETEAVLRSLVAGLARGEPDYDQLSPQFAEIVRRDLPMTHPMFSAFGELQSMTFRERGPMGDDAYDMVFANGAVTMSAALDEHGRMAGGILRPMAVAGR